MSCNADPSVERSICLSLAHFLVLVLFLCDIEQCFLLRCFFDVVVIQEIGVVICAHDLAMLLLIIKMCGSG